MTLKLHNSIPKDPYTKQLSSLLGASSSYGLVELIFLLPEGWMALTTEAGPPPSW